MVDLETIISNAEAEVQATVNAKVLEGLQTLKAERLSALEVVKADLNELDSHIAARTPQAEEVPTEEQPVG